MRRDKLEGVVNPPIILEREKKITATGICSEIMKSPAKKVLEIPPRVLRPSTKLKRKQQEEAREAKAQAKSSRKKAQTESLGNSVKHKNKQACLKLNKDGFVEVQVDYDLCSKIADGAGFQTAQVLQALQEDNEARFAQGAALIQDKDDSILPIPVQPPSVDEEDQGEKISETDFEPDSEDELDSDFE